MSLYYKRLAERIARHGTEDIRRLDVAVLVDELDEASNAITELLELLDEAKRYMNVSDERDFERKLNYG